MRVLIADDSMISRRLLEAALHKWGYDVVAVTDGTEAWECLKGEDPPRIAILDWMMPGLSGPDVCRRVRQNAGDRYTYILLVTSRSHKEDLIQGMEAGADDYITKPFDQNELEVRLGPGRRIVELQDALLAAQAALREQATKDALTGIWNRGTILDIMGRELSRSGRSGTPLGIALVDLDHFKSVNDRFGHIAGDTVLRETARRMKSLCRNYDSIGRYGGEEFLLVLPGCDAEAARRQAERLREDLEAAPISLEDVSLPLTASFGVTSLIPNGRTEPSTVLRTADNAMYGAKQNGRNQVVFADISQLDSQD